MVLDDAPSTFSYRISMDEPNNKWEYNQMKNAEIQIIFTFTINESSITTSDAN